MNISQINKDDISAVLRTISRWIHAVNTSEVDNILACYAEDSKLKPIYQEGKLEGIDYIRCYFESIAEGREYLSCHIIGITDKKQVGVSQRTSAIYEVFDLSPDEPVFATMTFIPGSKLKFECKYAFTHRNKQGYKCYDTAKCEMIFVIKMTETAEKTALIQNQKFSLQEKHIANIAVFPLTPQR
jgi:hypothetical protein